MPRPDSEETQCLVRPETRGGEKVASGAEAAEAGDTGGGGRGDGGGGWYGWLVVACSFLCVCVLDGVGYSFGVFFEPLLRELSGGQGRGVLAIAGSLQIGVYGFSSPLVARLVTRWGARPCCVLGGLVSAAGLGLASCSRSVPGLVLSYSVLTGLGFGLLYLPSVVIVPLYFPTRHRSLATSVVLCAAGVGTLVVAPLAQAMLAAWGWRGALRGLATIAGLVCTSCGLAMAPPPPQQQTGGGGTGGAGCSVLDPRILRSPRLLQFLVVGLGDSLATLSLYIPFTHLPAAVLDRGVSPAQASLLISVIGVSNTLGRLLAGWVTDQSWARPLATISLGTTLAAPCLFLLAAVPQLWLLLATCATFGLATGVWVAATPPALIRMLGLPALAPAFGLLTLSRGTAALGGPPLAGAVLDLVGGAGGVAMVVAGAGMAAACAIFTLATLLEKRTEWRSQYQQI